MMLEETQPSDDKLTKGTLEETPDHTVIQRISGPKELILIFWMDEKNKGGYLYTDFLSFKTGALTREKNIRRQAWFINKPNYRLYNEPIMAVHEIGTRVYEIINSYGGYSKARVKEINVFSYCGVDGPITYHSTVYPPLHGVPGATQMDMSGWEKINFNWVDDAPRCIFYGGFSAAEDNSFAKKLSLLGNFKNVTVIGQTAEAYLSFYPDYRVSSTNRRLGIIFSDENLYFVGGSDDDGWSSLCFSLKPIAYLDKEEIKSYPKAKPMHFYINGVLAEINSQEVFNDHRDRGNKGNT